jgi:16S rRNA (guanine527-N7)-methyltransferase
MVRMEGLQQHARRLLELSLTKSQLEAFSFYAAELIAWNERHNLTAITDPEGIEHKHFLDSLTCLRVIGRPSGGRLVDVGSGAGFPGLALKIACPHLDVTLIEATRKKVEFCQHMVDSLELDRVSVLHGRAEDAAHRPELRQKFDWAVARAVAQLPVLVEYLLPLVKLGGKAIALKGETGLAEAQAAEQALRVLGGRVQQVVPIELPKVTETRYLVVIEKTAGTPPEYPRRAGLPARRPLVDRD